MNPRFSLLLAFLLLLAGIWIFAVQPHWGSTQERARAQGLLLDFPSDSISRVEIQREDSTLVFVREPRGWTLTSPLADTASTPKLEEILQLAATLRAQERISASEFRGKLRSGSYGFNPAKLRLVLSDGRRTRDLEFGREASAPDRVFVRRGGSEETFVVPDTLAKNLLNPIDTFRDPRLVNLPGSLIDRLRLQWKDATLEVERTATGWQISRPLQSRADPFLMERLLENLLGAKIQSFVDPSERTGLARGQGRLLLWPEGAEKPLELAVAPEEDLFLLTHSERPGFFRVSPDNLALLTTPIDTLRLRQLDLCNPDQVDRFSITRHDPEPATEYRFEREGRDWLLHLEGRTIAVPGEKVARFFSALNQTRIDSFLAGNRAWNLTDPSPSLTLRFSSFLSENTPEARAGQHLIATLDLGSPIESPASGEDSTEKNNAPSAVMPARIEGSIESLLVDAALESTIREFLSFPEMPNPSGNPD